LFRLEYSEVDTQYLYQHLKDETWHYFILAIEHYLDKHDETRAFRPKIAPASQTVGSLDSRLFNMNVTTPWIEDENTANEMRKSRRLFFLSDQ
jgi:hypothetical protein